MGKSPQSPPVIVISAQNGNAEVPVYFLKAKQGYTARRMGGK
jgi:hypothetical protein